MAANIEEKVIEKLRVLPEDQQAEVLKFVEDLAGLETKEITGSRLSPNRSFKWRVRYVCKVLPIGLLGLMINFTCTFSRGMISGRNEGPYHTESDRRPYPDHRARGRGDVEGFS